jgi:hypothetical protein
MYQAWLLKVLKWILKSNPPSLIIELSFALGALHGERVKSENGTVRLFLEWSPICDIL